MGHTIHKLTATRIARTTRPGYYGDGGGLYLQITSAGVKSWVFRYMLVGRARFMGLGPLHTISLAEARVHALDCRKQLLLGIDPLDAKHNEQTERRLAAVKSKTFDECSKAYIEAQQAGWKSAKHAAQWTNTLATYASPVFKKLPVAKIDTALVMKVLEPIWYTKTETASRVRSRIELVLDWAGVHKYRSGENPARWKGHLDMLLPKRSKVQKVIHHPALLYPQIGTFVAALREQPGTAARALEFLILTATRTSEIIYAEAAEFDLGAKHWTIPEGRMKKEKEHRIPLSARALAIIKPFIDAARRAGRQHVFPGGKIDQPLSNAAMSAVLDRMGIDPENATVHGFRSTFRDWAGETTHHAREVIEAALSHQLEDKAEAAYARGTLFAKRMHLMNDWAKYCNTPPPVQIPLDTESA